MSRCRTAVRADHGHPITKVSLTFVIHRIVNIEDPCTHQRYPTTAALFVVPASFLRWSELADWLIARARIPYRLVDVVAIGERIVTLTRQDLATVWLLARQRGRGSLRRSVPLACASVVPVLVAAFRHADEVAVALESRGFGLHDTRTVHRVRLIRPTDIAILLLCWALTAAVTIVTQQ